MKKNIKNMGIIITAVAIMSCNNAAETKENKTAKNDTVMNSLVPRENFADTLNGKKISIYYLKNKNIEAAITNYGGRVVNLLIPDKDGKMVDVAIGFDNFKGFYNSKEPYFGATIGRYGNRIAKGKFKIDGVEYTLPLNNGVNTLHGGAGGFHNVVWDATQLSDSSLQLNYLSKDGEMGFPGNLTVKVIYTLTAGREMKIEYEATTDKKTVCNLTNHTFFNLNGGGTINNHLLMINADKYTPVDSTLIPLGKNESVEGTPFDFIKATAIGARVNDTNIQLGYGKGYDHNFVVNGEAGNLLMAAEATGDMSGIVMQIFSTEPGLQFYGGNFMQSKNELKGRSKDDFRTAFCLEPQHFPNSPNQPNFPSTILEPGKIYKTVTVYLFK
jgi:aldose 1-epimerase